jgi:hypothetical protein
MNYQDIIAQALRAGFQPYAGNRAQMQALVNGLEVTPYMEMTGQTEQDPGTSQQVGYTVSTPLGGTNYRTDVVDMNGNLQRSNVHDAGADKYGFGDMAKLAAVALGANALGSALGQPSMFSSGLLGSSTAPGLTGADAAMADLAASGGLTPASMGGAAGAAAVGGAAGGGAAGLGSLAGGMSGKVIGGLLGAAAGAANSGDKTQTTQQRLDPRMEAMLYGADGKGGYLGAAADWFNQNKGGNPLMLQGAQMMADFYRSPQYTEGYNSLRSTGLGLLNTPMAGNPFTQGGAQLPAMGGGMPSVAGPQMPQNKIDLSGAPGMEASPSFGGGMMDMRYRGGPQMTPEQRRQREADMLTMMNQARGFGG